MTTNPDKTITLSNDELNSLMNHARKKAINKTMGNVFYAFLPIFFLNFVDAFIPHMYHVMFVTGLCACCYTLISEDFAHRIE